jgi:hypothetical protein
VSVSNTCGQQGWHTMYLLVAKHTAGWQCSDVLSLLGLPAGMCRVSVSNTCGQQGWHTQAHSSLALGVKPCDVYSSSNMAETHRHTTSRHKATTQPLLRWRPAMSAPNTDVTGPYGHQGY